MNGLLELLFEDVSPQVLADILLDSVGDENNLIDARRDGVDVHFPSLFSPAYWSDFASSGGDASCIVNLRVLAFGSTLVSRPTLYIICYNDTIDVSILLSTEHCRQAELVASEKIYQFAKATSQRYGIDSFCGGLDSATDESTQLYSQNGVGAIASL